MKKFAPIALAATLALSGCAAQATPGPTPVVTSEPTASAASIAETTAPSASGTGAASIGEVGGVTVRGNQIIEVGQELPLWDADLKVGTWSIVSVAPYDTSQVENFEYDQAKHYFVMEIQAAATSDLKSRLRFGISGYDADGVLVNDGVEHIGSGVIPNGEDFPSWIGMGEKTRGKVLLALPTEHGSFKVSFSGGSAQGMPVPFGYEIAV